MDQANTPYFIGLSLPSDLDETIMAIKRRLFDQTEGALTPLMPHITLLHPPSLRSITPDELVPIIRSLQPSHLPLTLQLTTIEDFEGKVLYIRIVSPELEMLQRQLVQLLPEKDQVIYRRRGFIPHITLLQVRSPSTPFDQIFRDSLHQELGFPRSITIDSLSCFSHIGPRQYHAETI